MNFVRNENLKKDEDGPGIRLYNCISRIIITEQFTKQYLDVLMKYEKYIAAELVQKQEGSN